VATSVSQSRNYSLRAEKVFNDELGVLVDAFNDMLSRIEEGDAELRQALNDREEANRRLAQSNADLERFAFIASHDLQEPLRMVSLYTQLLHRHALLNSGPEAQEFVDQIVGGTRRMYDLLDDLRAYAEIRAEAELAPVDLNEAVAKATANLKLAIDTNGTKIDCSPLPSVRAYSGHFVALFQNLIGNAIKYRAQEPPRIAIKYEQVGETLRFAVCDNGVGIAPEYHAKIFVPFKRLHGPEIPGSGIGLAICQRIVERYGGTIWVESQLSRGATFYFTLPEAVVIGRSNSNGRSV
jgi:light-regulated signal transduction histidine kinase (bacteriophytochrome)